MHKISFYTTPIDWFQRNVFWIAKQVSLILNLISNSVISVLWQNQERTHGSNMEQTTGIGR